jgi:acetyl-CoA synthetase
MLKQQPTFDDVYRDFAWNIPEKYNVGFDVCDRWAEVDPNRLAIIDVNEHDVSRELTYSDLRGLSNQLANALLSMGVSNDGPDIADRIGVLLPQCAETAIAHIAATKMGCISIPLFTLFGEEALLHRLKDSGAKAIITNKEGCAKLAKIRDRLPDLILVLSIDGDDDGVSCFHSACAGQSDQFEVQQTSADDPAFLIYTSGTTGNPKGALHAHRVLLGHLPGVEISHNFLPMEGDRFWTPADWAWIGGLLDVLMPALHHGIPVVACRFSKFSAKAAFELIKKYKIRNTFLPPTAIKMMKLLPDAEGYHLSMRSVASGGETLGSELLTWGIEVFGTTINEFYGQTECNMVVSSCEALEAPKFGSMGRAVPGHTVKIVNSETGVVQPDGTEGSIAVMAPDPVMFLGYWNNPEATEEKFVTGPEGRWLLTGDRGARDEDGRFHFLGRDDDVIGSAGYRIGPAEVENCLIGHEAVRLAGVVGKPDTIRGSVVAAYVILRDGFSPSDELAKEIADFVKMRLAAHEYPRVVRFIDEMPMTTTGKIIRGELRKMAEQEALNDKALG